MFAELTEKLHYGHNAPKRTCSNESSSMGSLTPTATPDFYDVNYSDEQSATGNRSLSLSDVSTAINCSLSGFVNDWLPPSLSSTERPTRTTTTYDSGSLGNTGIPELGVESAQHAMGDRHNGDDDILLNRQQSNCNAVNMNSSSSELFYIGDSIMSTVSSSYDGDKRYQLQTTISDEHFSGKTNNNDDDRSTDLRNFTLTSGNKRRLVDDSPAVDDVTATTFKKTCCSEERNSPGADGINTKDRFACL